MLTIISLSDNVEKTARTTRGARWHLALPFTRTAQEGTSTGFVRVQLSAVLLYLSGGFHQPTFLCHSLYLLSVIISELGCMSRPSAKRTTLLTAYPAIAGGAAKTNSEGGESF